MSDIQQPEARPGNGADHTGPGAQNVATTLAAFAALGANPSADAIDAIIRVAVESGGGPTECDHIGKQLPKNIKQSGTTRDGFVRKWREIEKYLEAEAKANAAYDDDEAPVEEAGDDENDFQPWLSPHSAEAAEIRERLLPAVQPLLDRPNILDDVVKAAHARGLVGAEPAIKAHYLTYTSRLAAKPVSMNGYGAPAGGKSYLVEEILFSFFPDGAYVTVNASSPKLFAYIPPDSLKQRILYIGEAIWLLAATKDDVAKFIQSLMRQFQSSGFYVYRHLEMPGPDDANRTPRPRTRRLEGPVAIISTSTSPLQDENNTRTLTVAADESEEHTAAVMLQQAIAATQSQTNLLPDMQAWQDAQTYLAAVPFAVVVPFAVSLSALIAHRALRTRRDFPALLTLIQTHAFLHQMRRKCDPDGNIIATLEDYAGVHAAFDDVFDDTAGLRIEAGMDRLYQHILKLAQQQLTQRAQAHSKTGLKVTPAPGARPTPLSPVAISIRALAEALGWTRMTTHRRVKSACEDGLFEDMRENKARGSTELLRLRPVTDGLAAQRLHWLPSPQSLTDRWAQDRSETNSRD
jgi:hypothetical protein